jgi:peroxiredoxin
MTRSIGTIALLALVLGSVAGLQYLHRPPSTGYSAPDFTLPDLTGRPYRLSELRGKVVLLNLWATWCPPCRSEMPSMEALFRRLEHRDFALLAVAEDESGAAAIREFVSNNGLSFPVLLDPDATLSPRYGATGYPETFIIDRNGEVVNHTIGPAEWDSPQMVAYFERLLAEPRDDRERAER